MTNKRYKVRLIKEYVVTELDEYDICAVRKIAKDGNICTTIIKRCEL